MGDYEGGVPTSTRLGGAGLQAEGGPGGGEGEGGEETEAHLPGG